MYCWYAPHGRLALTAARRLSWPSLVLVAAMLLFVGWIFSYRVAGTILAMILLGVAWIVADAQRRERRQFQDPYELQQLRNLTPFQFSLLITDYYQRKGYRVIPSQLWGSDQGLDVLLRRSTQLLACQWRHYRARRVSPQTVYDFARHVKALNATKGLLLITGDIQPDLERVAERLNIKVITGERLQAMLNGYIMASGPPERRRQHRAQRPVATGSTQASGVPSSRRHGLSPPSPSRIPSQTIPQHQPLNRSCIPHRLDPTRPRSDSSHPPSVSRSSTERG